MQIEIGTKLRFRADEPRTVTNIKLNFDYESIAICFDSGESVSEKEIRSLMDAGRCTEVFV